MCLLIASGKLSSFTKNEESVETGSERFLDCYSKCQKEGFANISFLYPKAIYKVLPGD